MLVKVMVIKLSQFSSLSDLHIFTCCILMIIKAVYNVLSVPEWLTINSPVKLDILKAFGFISINL